MPRDRKTLAPVFYSIREIQTSDTMKFPQRRHSSVRYSRFFRLPELLEIAYFPRVHITFLLSPLQEMSIRLSQYIYQSAFPVKNFIKFLRTRGKRPILYTEFSQVLVINILRGGVGERNWRIDDRYADFVLWICRLSVSD